jgi:hypothetical protein
MSNWIKDKAWSDHFIPEIASILGPLMIKPAPIILDTRESTDLMILTARDIRVGARVRRPGYACRYAHEFTMRSSRVSGVDTELDKIIAGFCDWMFYAHAADNGKLAAWMVICLNSFRSHLILHPDEIMGACVEKNNWDGETTFLSFDVRGFKHNPPILIARSEAPAFGLAAA